MTTMREEKVPHRVMDNLRMLREALAKEAFACSGLHHILVAHNDDLSADVTYGPEGFIQQGKPNAYMAQKPLRGPLEVVATESMAVLQAPEWTEKGKAYRLEPMTFNWNPDARRELIAKPGIVANGFLLAKWFDREIEHRRNRFQSLTSDIMICLRVIADLPQLSTIDIADRINRRAGSKADEATWMRIVHRMGWENHNLSLTRAQRKTWLWNGPRSIMFLPYDADELKPLLELPFGPLQGRKGSMAVPPDRFVSELAHDPFTESAYAIDDIVSLLEGETLDRNAAPRSEEMPTELIPRDKVFVSYSRIDKSWLDDIMRMLSPAIRNHTLQIWYDRKTKPGEVWRQEIEQAMESARIGLLLVTDNFLDSDFINMEELPYLMKAAAGGGVQILWIAVGHCLFEQTALKELQALNDPAKPLKDLAKPKREKELKQMCKEILEHYKRTDGQNCRKSI